MKLKTKKKDSKGKLRLRKKLVIFLISLCFLLMAKKCPSDPPNWDAELCLGDAGTTSIICPEQKQIMCQDEEFNGYTCTKHENIIRLYEIFSQCKDWD